MQRPDLDLKWRLEKTSKISLISFEWHYGLFAFKGMIKHDSLLTNAEVTIK